MTLYKVFGWVMFGIGVLAVLGSLEDVDMFGIFAGGLYIWVGIVIYQLIGMIEKKS